MDWVSRDSDNSTHMVELHTLRYRDNNSLSSWVAPSLFSLSIQHKRWCDFHISPTHTFFFLATSFRPVSQSDPVNALMHRFHARHLAGEITSRRHKRKKTMMGGHFRAKIISISSKEPSLWQSQPLQFSVRPWWSPAGGTSLCKSFSLEIFKIDPERKSLIMTSRQTAAASRSVDITIYSVIYKHSHKHQKSEMWLDRLEISTL